MSILVDENTKLIVQGLGRTGKFHAGLMREAGTNIVAAAHPGRGGTEWEGIPIYNTMAEAMSAHDANASVIFVPPPGAADAILEAAATNVPLAICITEGVPTLDMVRARHYLRDFPDTRLVGPNCPGVISPGKAKIGIMPWHVHKQGPIGVISRSGTLTYEAVGQLSALDIGQSTCIGIGGDPVGGMDFIDCLELFQADPDTKGVILIGEIGGNAEEQAAAYIKEHVDKPVAAFIAGATAPPGKRMGHAGAIISGGKGTASEKQAAMEAAGVKVSPTPAEMAATLQSIL